MSTPSDKNFPAGAKQHPFTPHFKRLWSRDKGWLWFAFSFYGAAGFGRTMEIAYNNLMRVVGDSRPAIYRGPRRD